jgi:hypothetical protein
MKKSLFLLAVLLFAVSGFADTTYNNFNGYSDYWNPFGNPNTATYGELFTAPSNGDTNLTSFSFYMGSPTAPGNILLGGYIATWDGNHAGSLLYSSPQYNYDNNGHEQISFDTGGVNLQGGAQYVMFLSVSQYYGQSAGETSVSQGGSINGLNGFAWYNNSGDFNSLFTNSWDNYGASPDWAVDLEFNNAVPEPSSLLLLGSGLLGGLGVLRRKLF